MPGIIIPREGEQTVNMFLNTEKAQGKGISKQNFF